MKTATKTALSTKAKIAVGVAVAIAAAGIAAFIIVPSIYNAPCGNLGQKACSPNSNSGYGYGYGYECRPPYVRSYNSVCVESTFITTHPVNLTRTVGQSAAFSIVTSGTAPYVYQWRKNGVPIFGSTSSTYSIPSVTPDSAGYYNVFLTTVNGVVASKAALLTVEPAPTACNDATPPNGCSTSRPLLCVPGVGTASSNLEYRASVCGCPAGQTPSGNLCVMSVATSTASPVFPNIIVQPVTQTKRAGEIATFSVVAGGTTPLTYQWLKNGSNIIGATSSTYSIVPNVSQNGEVYSVVITNSVGSISSVGAPLSVTTAPLAVTVSPPITNTSIGPTISLGGFAASNNTKTVTYISPNWFSNDTFPTYNYTSANLGSNSIAVFVDDQPVSTYASPGSGGYLSASYKPLDKGIHSIYLKVINSAGQPIAKSNIVSITIIGNPTITAQPISQIKRVGDTATFTVAASRFSPGLRYQWRKNGIDIPGATSSRYATTILAAQESSVYSAVVTDALGGSTTSDTAKLTVSFIYSVRPATNSIINNIQSTIGWSVDRPFSSGVITMRRIGGTPDNASHVCTLKGNTLTAGPHTFDMRNTSNCAKAQSLVHGAIYTITFSGKDVKGNAALTISSSNITFLNR